MSSPEYDKAALLAHLRDMGDWNAGYRHAALWIEELAAALREFVVAREGYMDSDCAGLVPEWTKRHADRARAALGPLTEEPDRE